MYLSTLRLVRGLLPLCSMVLLAGPAGAAPDLAREQRIRAQIQRQVSGEETVTLQTGQLEFLALHRPAETPKAQGGLILLHGREAHPDWAPVIRPLRLRLPAHGWETLAPQLPLPSSDSPERAYSRLIAEALPRVAFAVEFLKSRQVTDLVVVGHDLGARVALEWLARDDAPREVRACVVIGLAVEPQQPDGGVLGALKRIKRPILDVYGSRDPAALDSAPQRAAAARVAENAAYRQLPIEGADHLFTGLDDTLVTRVRAWLARVRAEPPSPEAPPPDGGQAP